MCCSYFHRSRKAVFFGQIADLCFAASHSTKPFLVKDVILDKIQIDWYRLHGANAILLNANPLQKMELRDLLSHVLSYDMDPFVEVHDLIEFETAQEVGAKVIAIHNINPETWEIDKSVTEKISKRIQKEDVRDRIIVHASGVKTIEDLKRIREIRGIKAVLIGTALMGQPQLIYDFKKTLEE